jgi:acetyltransferase-like isoleucine patch superfamily enzyme
MRHTPRAAHIDSPAAERSSQALHDRVAAAEALFASGATQDARAALAELLEPAAGDDALVATILSDLAVIAARDGGLEEAARLATQATSHDPEHTAALEVLEVCSGVLEQRAAAFTAQLQRPRIESFRNLWTCARVSGEPALEQPVILAGRGCIEFGPGVRFGWRGSPGFLDGYGYVEAYDRNTRVAIGADTTFNNGVTLRSEGPGITIGRRCLFGWSVEVWDSDFHELHPQRRLHGTPATAHVAIGDNVFIGARTLIMKGVSIGDDTVIGAGLVVVHSLPASVIAAGNPARVIRALEV